MVAIRFTIQVLVALAAAMSVQAYPYADAVESLAARSNAEYDVLNARDVPSYGTRYVARGYSDDGLSFVARDLAGLGIRSEDISHILVVRMSSPAGLSKAELQQHLARLKPELAQAQQNVKTISAAVKAAMKARNAAEQRIQQKKLEDARGMVETYQEYVTHYQAELKKHP